MSIKAIIFDLDGVITDSDHVQQKTEFLTLDYFGIKASLSEWDNIRGRTTKDVFQYFIEKYGKNELRVEDLIDYKLEIYEEVALREAKIFEGAIEVLEELKDKGFKIVLVTSGMKKMQKVLFDKFNLWSFFEIIITNEDIKRGKPDPEPYLLAVKKLALPAEQCLVVEDSDNGIISAKRAGCQAVGITNTFSEERLKSVGVDYVINHLKEIKGVIGGQV